MWRAPIQPEIDKKPFWAEKRRFFSDLQEAEQYTHFLLGKKSAPAERYVNFDNVIKTVWVQLRESLARYRAAIGARNEALAQQRAWLGDLRGKRVLEIGCGEGSLLTLEIAAAAEEYVGVDLEGSKIRRLQEKLDAQGLKSARAIQGDVLGMSGCLGQFDVIYSCSVLHAFPDIDKAAQGLQALLRPGGRIVAWEPMNTGPAVRLVRGLYRPFQPDRMFHYPLRCEDVQRWGSHFTLAGVRGFLGWSKWGYPIYILPGGRRLGARLGSWLCTYDSRKNSVKGCHQIVMLLLRQ